MPKANQPPGADGVQAVVLALRIVEYMAAQRESVALTDMARALQTTKSRIYRYLRTLVSEGFVEQEKDTERYRVGPRLNQMGRNVTEAIDLVVIARRVLRPLRDQLGHFTVVSQVEPGGPRVIATLSGTSVIEIGVKAGSLLGYHATAQGKVVLAFGSPELRDRVMGSRLEMLTPDTIVSPQKLEQELEQVRQLGYATAANESMVGVNGLAAPVFDSSGALIATLAIVDSVQFIAKLPSQIQVQQVLAAARRMSAELGYTAPPSPPSSPPSAATG